MPPGHKAPGMAPLRGPPAKRPRRGMTAKVMIPEGVPPGGMFTVQVGGDLVQVQCPPNMSPGGYITIEAAPPPPPPPPMSNQDYESLRAAMKEKVLRSLSKESSFSSLSKSGAPSPDKGKGKGKEKGKRKYSAKDAADDAAASWLSRGGRGPSRVDKAAALAEEYFRQSMCQVDDEEPAAKKQKTIAFAFTQEILDKAPDNLQTVRSLQLFLEKKLQAAAVAPAEVGGPQALKAGLEAYALKVGRLNAMRSTSGWDARAKRTLDVLAVAKTAPGVKAFHAAENSVEKEKGELEKKLKEKGDDKLEDIVEKRAAWAQDWMKREWLLWCSRLLQAREAALVKASGEDAQASPPVGGKEMSAACILAALLSGEGGLPVPAPAPPKAEEKKAEEAKAEPKAAVAKKTA